MKVGFWKSKAVSRGNNYNWYIEKIEIKYIYSAEFKSKFENLRNGNKTVV